MTTADRYRVAISPRAVRDLEEILNYVAAASPERAAGLLGKLVSRIDSLARTPLIHARAPQSLRTRREVRQAIERPFRIVFEVRGSTVNVLTVRHAARRPTNPG
ncbi:MAG: type II toxin-antitoxin system RelE/ParE family toxin [Phycisphaerales bacterium]